MDAGDTFSLVEWSVVCLYGEVLCIIVTGRCGGDVVK